jgi:hypothetical protein
MTAWIALMKPAQEASSLFETAVLQAVAWDAMTSPMSVHPMHPLSFVQSAAAPPSPVCDPLLDPLEEPLLDPLEEPLEPPLDPLPPPLVEPPLDPLLDPLEEPLLDPLEEPLLLPEPSVAVDASSPVPKPVFGLLLDEHAASNPNTPLDANTNLFILRIVLSSTGLCRAARQAPARCPKRAL